VRTARPPQIATERAFVVKLERGVKLGRERRRAADESWSRSGAPLSSSSRPEPVTAGRLVPRFHGTEGCSAQQASAAGERKGDKKIGKIRKVEGAAAKGAEGL
jgi:hypothetical protein